MQGVSTQNDDLNISLTVHSDNPGPSRKYPGLQEIMIAPPTGVSCLPVTTTLVRLAGSLQGESRHLTLCLDQVPSLSHVIESVFVANSKPSLHLCQVETLS